MTEFWQAFCEFLSLERGDLFARLAILTEETAAQMNITAHKTLPEICVYHILDSVSVADQIPDQGCVCDVGTGGGFPGLVLAILRPETEFTLLDATEKKVRAVERTAQDLGLTNVRALCGRAEELGSRAFRDRFDLVVSRAVAPLEILAELCLPLVKSGGAFCAMKGRRAAEERAAAKKILQTLGAKERLCRREVLQSSAVLSAISALPADADRALIDAFCAMERHTLVYQKTRPTPQGYPRSFAKIKQANRPKREE